MCIPTENGGSLLWGVGIYPGVHCSVNSINAPYNSTAIIYGGFLDDVKQVQIGTSLGGVSSRWNVLIPGMGHLCLDDLGEVPGSDGTYAVLVQRTYQVTYDGGGAFDLTVNEDGTVSCAGGKEGPVVTKLSWSTA